MNMTIGLAHYINGKKIGDRVSFFVGTDLFSGRLETLVPMFSVKLTEACVKRFGFEKFSIRNEELKDEGLMTVGEGKR